MHNSLRRRWYHNDATIMIKVNHNDHIYDTGINIDDNLNKNLIEIMLIIVVIIVLPMRISKSIIR